MTTLVAVSVALAAAACVHTLQPTSVCTQAITYTLGDTAVDSLSGQDCKQTNGAYADFYTFSTTGQEDFVITLRSPTLYTFLQLIDRATGSIVMNSAVTSNVDTVTTVRMKVAQGNFALAVNAVNAGSTGRYTLVTTQDTAAVKGCGTVWVTPGILTTQTITSADCTQSPYGGSFYTHVYTVVLLRAQEANFSEHSTAFPPDMVLVGPSGTTASTPDSLGTTALISATVTTQGAYQLWVGSSTASQFGVYTLQIK